MKKYIPLFILPLVLYSCIPAPVEIEVPQADSKLVVASQMLFSQGVLIQLSKSFNAITETPTNGDTVDPDFLDFLLIDSARVIIDGPTTSDTLFPLEQGFYLGLGTEFIQGELYTLSVFDSASGQQVRAESRVLEQPALGEISYEFITDSLIFGDTLFKDTAFQLMVSFDDLPGQSYYMLNLIEFSQGEPQDAVNVFAFSQGQPTITYTDALLGSQSTFHDTLIYQGIGLGDTVGITLSHISQDYYDYLLARERSGTSIFASLLGEPVNFPSNVEGGFGFFNLTMPDAQVIVVD